MSAKGWAKALVAAGEIPVSAMNPFWWEQIDAYWALPFYAEMNLCCIGLSGTDDWQAAREQLWAVREDLA